MSKRKFSWIMLAFALPALVLGVIVSVAHAEEGIDPAKADRLIQIALIDDSVLNGSGWTTRHNDWSDSPVPDTAACKASVGKLQDIEKSLDAGRAGRGKVSMVQDPEPGEAPVTVEVEIYVYKTAAPLAAAFKDLKTIYASKDLTTCFVTQLDEDISGITGAAVAPYLPKAAADPKAAPYAAEFKASQFISPIRVEHYSAYLGNTLVMMTFTGPKPAVDKSTVEFLVELQGMAVELVAGY